MEDHLISYQKFNFELIRGKLSPSFTTQYYVNFNFTFQFKISEFTTNSGSVALTSRIKDTMEESVHVPFKIMPARETAQLFALDTWRAITTALACLPLTVTDHNRRRLIDFAIGEANQAVRNTMYDVYEAVDLDILVRIEDWQQVDHHQGSCTDSSMLRKWDGTMSDDCCICRQEMVSEGWLVAMPCQHVFHGGCIRKWLNYSHYCPLCRFLMPTATPQIDM